MGDNSSQLETKESSHCLKHLSREIFQFARFISARTSFPVPGLNNRDHGLGWTGPVQATSGLWRPAFTRGHSLRPVGSVSMGVSYAICGPALVLETRHFLAYNSRQERLDRVVDDMKQGRGYNSVVKSEN
ncbi:hypothetical protein RRG08_058630 [Elysia crispata]|uniref:Uncharacterized protein n=1 Tax=Elysia crispata TaxID=231223 RepID=A0AAE0Z2E3_9GAST|nr:hypothetical protein RRG08_058630 [Elysia crispata]